MDYEVTYVDDPPFWSPKPSPDEASTSTASSGGSNSDCENENVEGVTERRRSLADVMEALQCAAFCGDRSGVSEQLSEVSRRIARGTKTYPSASAGSGCEISSCSLQRAADRIVARRCAVDDYGCSPLHDAARGGDASIVQRLLRLPIHAHVHHHTKSAAQSEDQFCGEESPLLASSSKQSVDSSHSLRLFSPFAVCDALRTPLHEACKFGNAEAAAALIAAMSPAATTDFTNTAVGERVGTASCSGNSDDEEVKKAAVRVGVWSADERGRTALHLAAANGRANVVRMLLEPHVLLLTTADVEGRCAEDAIEKKILARTRRLTAEVLRRDRRGYTPLHLAAARGHVACLLALLESCTTADDADNRGAVRAAETANESGAPRLVRAILFAEGRRGDSALHCAALNGHAEALTLLADRMAITYRDGGAPIQTEKPLQQRYNCFINKRDVFGRTPFFCAASGDWVAAMAALREMGCDDAVPNNKGKQPNA